MVDAARHDSRSGERAPPAPAAGASLSIEYCNTAEDLTELHASTWWYYRWLRRVPRVAIAALVLLLLDFFVRGQMPRRDVLFPVLALALLSSTLRDSEERRMRWMFHAVHDPGLQRVAISPAGLVTGFPPQETAWAWGQVDRIEGDDHCLYFHCAERTKEEEVCVIPRRTFRSPTQADAFLALARRYRDRARSIEGG